MDSRHAQLLRDVDPAVLGTRMKALRVARGLTQTQVAGPGVSVGYVSRMESGQRRPTAKVLVAIAERLGAPLEHLLGGMAPREVDEFRLTLDFAELSLESGEPAEAEARTHEVLERLASSAGVDDLVERARLLQALSWEALGRTDDAILALEDLIDGGATGLTRVNAALALTRSYRDSGDLGRAIGVGERMLAELAEGDLDACDEAVQLAVTVASAHFEQGDEGHAVRVCRRAIAKAEGLGSPVARASAYWNASMMQTDRGQIGEALPLAERALALLGEGKDARNLARLRAELGRMQLCVDPPELDAARSNLEQAQVELGWTSASPVELSAIQLNLARAHLLAGDLPSARDLVSRASDGASGAPLVAAEVAVLEGEMSAMSGDAAGAANAFQRAVHLLTGVGADREAAQLWFDLADLLEGAGMPDAARDAYRRAAASSGLRARSRSSAPLFAQTY